MEISPFPFLSQDDFTPLYTLFQELDNLDNSNNNNNNTINNTMDTNEANLKKRKRNEEEEGKKNARDVIDNILSSLLLLEEEEKQEREQLFIESQQDKALIEDNYKREFQVMNDYHSQIQSHYSNLDDLHHLHNKRARGYASVATVASVLTESSGSVDNNGGGSVAGPVQQRRLWVKDRSKDWWDMCSHPDYPEEEFKKAFRMGKATFDMICEGLDSVVMKKNTMLRDAIPVRQRVAVCIWRLATGEPLRLVSKRFGLGISTCHKLVLEVCTAIRTVLLRKFIGWPDEGKMKAIKREYESLSGIKDVGGSIYTTHVPIIAPKVNVASYFNRRHTERNQKTSYSITVQGVVDPRGIFTDVSIGWPGSLPDDQVLEKSLLFQNANKGLLKDVWIVGNSGYPLMDWLLVPYTHQNLTWTQHAFNEKVGEIQRIARDAFARLKGRWGCLQKRTEVKLQDLPIVLGACCVLHNICEMSNEEMDPELNFELFDDEMIPENVIRSVNASQARDNIAHNLLHHGLAGTSFL